MKAILYKRTGCTKWHIIYSIIMIKDWKIGCLEINNLKALCLPFRYYDPVRMASCIPYTYAAIAAEYRFRFSFLSLKSKTILYEIVLLNFLIYNLDQIKCYMEYSKFYIVC